MNAGDRVVIDQGFIFAQVVQVVSVGDVMVVVKNEKGIEREVTKWRLSPIPKIDVIEVNGVSYLVLKTLD